MISNSIPVPLPPLLSLFFSLISGNQSSLQVNSGKERSRAGFGGYQDLVIFWPLVAAKGSLPGKLCSELASRQRCL